MTTLTCYQWPKDISEGAIGATLFVEDGIVQSIKTDIYYPLQQVLEIYGPPNEVWITVDTQSLNSKAPFSIVLFYLDQGILSIYDGATEKGKIKICLSEIGGYQQAWLLWNPGLNLSFELAGRQAMLFTARPSDRPFYNLERVTSMDIKTFYETYREPENAQGCFEMEIQP